MNQKYDVVDADGHILEPPTLWEEYIEPKYRDTCPKLIVKDDGTEVFRIEDHELDIGQTFGLLGSIGSREGENSITIPYLDGRPGGFDPHPRIKDMDREGIDAAVLYPSLGLFAGTVKDIDTAAAGCRAYNRWLADYCSAYPERLFGAAMVPLQSVDHAIQELEFAVHELGYRAIFLRPNPYDGRPLHHPDHDRLWAVAQDLDVAVGIHEGMSSGQPDLGVDRFETFASRHCVSHTLEIMAAAASVIMCGVADRFPRLRFGFLEASGGWMVGWIDRMDRHYTDKGMNDSGLTMLPSDIFRRQCFIAFEPVEGALPILADYLGPDNILWATDYPHVDGFWNAPKLIRDMGMPEKTLASVLGGGARRFYQLQ